MSNAEAVTAGLEAALDDHVNRMRELVELSQREQQHLLAFEVRELVSCTEEKRALTAQLERSEHGIRQELEACGVVLGLERPRTTTVKDVSDRCSAEAQQALASRVTCLQALAGSLRELQGMTLVQAERGQRLVRAYASLLRSNHNAPEASVAGDMYTAKGRPRAVAMPRGTIARNV